MKRNHQKLKYRLAQMAVILPFKMTEKEFCEKLGIPWSTYQKDKSTLKTDRFSMPESRLYRYAKAYGVKMEDILNYKIDVLCLDQMDEEEMVRRVAAEFGLSRSISP